MAKIDSNVEITLRKVRVLYEHVFTAQVPKADKDGKVGKPSFNLTIGIDPKDTKQDDLILDAIDECKEKMWGKNPPKIKSHMQPYHDGNEEDNERLKGFMYLSCRNYRRPGVVHSKKDADGKFIVLDGSEGVFYAGCHANVIVRIWAQDTASGYGNRVNCSLESVQFHSDGDPLASGSSIDPNKGFEGLEGPVDDDEEDFRANRGRRRARDDEEEEKPARSRASRDEDDDDRAAGRRRGAREKDEEEEDRPRRRSSSRNDDGDVEAERARDRAAGRRSSRDGDDDDDRNARRRSRDEEDERPARRRSSAADEDERGTSRRRSSEDDDARPSRRPRADEEDEAPRSRSRDDESDRDRRRSRSSRDNDDLM